ncbi:C-Myc-binding protein like protein [Tritrichomonas foetus]|uniref:c-Myc-binding protein like protein n=1 Tax=Tritrichomonas foetus TaxID=1144522 RepID=A0A1J4L535_9EUKA|nr:C-Myc-binding protein like protein [Tritrichomonas foetus]|eukprot:OHT17046.1 C-Myc-binding protein like protein [Tritrichomonas foetus]
MENKREAFRKYLDNGGVLDSLTRVLVALYEEPENPEDALEYIKQFLGSPNGVDVESLQKENEELEQQVATLKERVTELKTQLGIENEAE